MRNCLSPAGALPAIKLFIQLSLIWLSLGTSCLLVQDAVSDELPADWLKAPPGFKVTHFSDDQVASDIYCMTTDRMGRLVVAGPGYIRILLDQDGDGTAESSKLFSSLPANGAQGMCFDGTDLYCVGDRGILRFRDQNRDDRADGPPQLMMALKTGGEHDSHAIRKGPDGWWYLISGNYSGVGTRQVTSYRSPVKRPVAGVITRIRPDFRASEIVADGFRNAYDFDFDESGDIFVYDSDGERDVSLPWYQPTRVYQVIPGANAGWVTRSWKRPDDFLDMQNVVSRLGRGSPTGVECYRHRQFPSRYQNAVFVLDWTFGRVIAVFPDEEQGKEEQGKNLSRKHELFLSAKGQHGFAPTDACVGVDGSLYVSVGGRGTRGSVYRIRYEDSAAERVVAPTTIVDALDLPQPLSSWSRALWENFAIQTGKEELEKAIFNDSLAVAHRIRAVEILVDRFGAISKEKIEALNGIKDSRIQARLAWAVLRQPVNSVPPAIVFHFLNHESDPVRIAAWQTLTGLKSVPAFLAEPALKALKSDNRLLQKSVLQFVASSQWLPSQGLRDQKIDDMGSVVERTGYLSRQKAYDLTGFQLAWRLLEKEPGSAESLDLLRLLQLALGGTGERSGLPQVFEGYNAQSLVSPPISNSQVARIQAGLKDPSDRVRHEWIRYVAMARVQNSQIVDAMLAMIDEQSPLLSDLHILIAIARCESNQDSQRTKLVESLLRLPEKLILEERKQDRNWEPRVKEIVTQLLKRDPGLGTALAEQGLDSERQLFLFDFIPANLRSDAIAKLVTSLQADPDFEMTAGVVRLLGRSSLASHRELIRDAFDDELAQDVAIEILARQPVAEDRQRFVEGIKSPQIKTVRIAAQALLKLPADRSASEQVALFQAMRRIGVDKEGYQAREWVVRVLQRNLQQSFGFQFGAEGFKTQKTNETQWMRFLKSKFPDQAEKLTQSGGFDAKAFEAKFAGVAWDEGDVSRGEKLFAKLTCAKCHGDRNRLGPDLAGVTKRFSRKDLFLSIVDPGFQVPSRYQTSLFETNDGRLVSGIVIYDSVDGVLLRDVDNNTVRLEKNDILRRQTIQRSLMPEGLLDEASEADFADLNAFLESMN